MAQRSVNTPPMQPVDFDMLRAELDRYHEHGTTHLAPHTAHVDSRMYVDPDVLGREIEQVFDRVPLIGCATSEIATAGSVLSRQVSGRPLLFVRQRDRTVRCFLNSCRHRGSAVVTEEYSCPRRLVCSYHGWNYHLDGTHAGHPNRAAFDGERPRDLIEMRCAELAGLVWVMFDEPGGRDPMADMGDLAAELGSMAFNGYAIERSLTRSVAANWKLIVEGFLEMYHVRHLHPTTLSPHQPGDVATFDRIGRSGRVVAPRRSYVAGVADPARFLESTLFVYHLFPNAILSWLTDHFELWQFEPHRTDPGITYARWSVMVRPVESKGTRLGDANQRIVERTVFGEDWPAAESIQRNAAFVGDGEPFVIGRNEPAIQHLHAGLRELGAGMVLTAQG